MKSASKWVREETKGLKKTIKPHLSSGVKISKKWNYGIETNALGYAFFKSNNVYFNGQFVSLFSTMFSDGHGLSILPTNFRKVSALFTARKTIKRDWINDKDEYMKPKG